MIGRCRGPPRNTTSAAQRTKGPRGSRVLQGQNGEGRDGLQLGLEASSASRPSAFHLNLWCGPHFLGPFKSSEKARRLPSPAIRLRYDRDDGAPVFRAAGRDFSGPSWENENGRGIAPGSGQAP